MHRSYQDITSRIAEEPKWWDENAVPRYDEFSYTQLGIYIRYAILAEIACQVCTKRMKIGIGFDAHNVTYHMKNGEPCTTVEATDIEYLAKNFAWGDPPNHGCIGDTMGSVEIAILEVWQQGPDERGHIKEGTNYKVLSNEDFVWARKPNLEGPIPIPDWFNFYDN